VRVCVCVCVCVYVRVLYSGYHGALVMTHKSGYDWFHPAANDWRTKHPVPDTAPPLRAE
jgi:hypothetical protein